MTCFVLSYHKDGAGASGHFSKDMKYQRTMESGVCCLKNMEDVMSESGRSLRIER